MKFIMLGALLFLFQSCENKKDNYPQHEGKLLPSFNLLLIDSTTKFNTSSITGGNTTVLLFLSPYCPYCKAQTEEIIKNINLLSNINFYIMTNFSFSELKKYYRYYKLENYSNITVGQDYNSDFLKYFNTTHVPFLAIYDKHNHLKRTFIGAISATNIKNTLE